MKKTIRHIWLFLAILILGACVREELPEESLVGKSPAGCVALPFGHTDYDEIEVNTRAVGGEASQFRVDDVFLLVYDRDGQRIYSHFFDDQNHTVSTDKEYWTVANRQNSSDGLIQAKIPQVQNGTLFLIANPHLLDLTREVLQAQTRTLEELSRFYVGLPTRTIFRTQLVMAAHSRVNVTKKNNNENQVQLLDGNQKLLLKRIDSKVKVNIRIATPEEQKAYYTPANGYDENFPIPNLKAFIPVSWQVKKLSKKVRLMDYVPAGIPVKEEKEHFDTDIANFETEVTEGNHIWHGFAFYMMENRQPAQPQVTHFYERDLRKKNADGTYDLTGEPTGDLWVHAPQDATYLRIKGRLQMVTGQWDELYQEDVPVMLHADVNYDIHLGDIQADLGDYSVLRNTSYTYNIVIYGADKIQLEVNKEEEDESGAMGDTYMAREAYHEFDAHYGQRVFRFCAEHMEVGKDGQINLTWYVKTPFGEGSPESAGLGGLDYKWVKFMRNKVKTNQMLDNGTRADVYSRNNLFYPGDDSPELMDVDQFIKYLLEQARRFHYNAAHQGAGEFQYPCDFKLDWDGLHHSIYFTVFVDEYYYEQNPITGGKVEWTEYTNKEDRMMHLLSRHKRSDDDASSVTESVVTIRQYAIQTPYVMDAALSPTVWGVETFDEPVITRPVKDQYGVPTYEYYPTWFYSENDRLDVDLVTQKVTNSKFPVYPTATSDSDGLSNTLAFVGVGKRWDDFLAVTRGELPENDYSFLKNGQRSLKNSILLRNRDSNGNGVIDAEEIKWYIGALEQLTLLSMADVGIKGDAKSYPTACIRQYRDVWDVPGKDFVLYNEKGARHEDQDSYGFGRNGNPDTQNPNNKVAVKGRHHLLSSTITELKGPRLLWAEELFSVSDYTDPYKWGLMGTDHIRSFRNMGPGTRPDPLISFQKKGNGENATYYFDMSRVNALSLRHRGLKVEPNLAILDPSTEREENSYLPLGLETGSFIAQKNLGSVKDYPSLKNALIQGNPICPKGYRVPNLREAGLFYLYADDVFLNKGSFVSTEYSLYSIPLNKAKNKYSWAVTKDWVTLDSVMAQGIRCVRDWDPRK